MSVRELSHTLNLTPSACHKLIKRGMPTSCPGTTGVAASVGGGTVSRPDQPSRHLQLSGLSM